MSLDEFAKKIESMYHDGTFNDWEDAEGMLDPMTELEIVQACNFLHLAVMAIKKADLHQIRGRAEFTQRDERKRRGLI